MQPPRLCRWRTLFAWGSKVSILSNADGHTDWTGTQQPCAAALLTAFSYFLIGVPTWEKKEKTPRMITRAHPQCENPSPLFFTLSIWRTAVKVLKKQDSRNVFDIFKGNTPFNHQKNNSEMNCRWLRVCSWKQLVFFFFWWKKCQSKSVY